MTPNTQTDDDAQTDDRPTVYLAGPVGHSPDAPSGWREDLIDTYGDRFAFRDPLSKYNIPAEDLTVVDGVSAPDDETTVGTTEIVHGDKELIADSDAVLVGYTAVRSIGTPMEVMWAFDRDYPISLWVRDDTPREALSPWYRHHVGGIYGNCGAALGALANAVHHRERAAATGGVADE